MEALKRGRKTLAKVFEINRNPLGNREIFFLGRRVLVKYFSKLLAKLLFVLFVALPLQRERSYEELRDEIDRKLLAIRAGSVFLVNETTFAVMKS